jgi:hypothetical protein
MVEASNYCVGYGASIAALNMLLQGDLAAQVASYTYRDYELYFSSRQRR